MINHNPDQTCENCLCFQFKPGTRTNNGWCKAAPPVRLEPLVRSRGEKIETQPQSSFPTVTPDQWCAQWHPAFVPPSTTTKPVSQK